MADETPETPAPEKPPEPKPFFTRWVHRLFYFYMVMVPTLAGVSLFGLSGTPGEFIDAVFDVHVALNWLIGGSLLIAAIAYLGVAVELCRPPKSPLLTLIYILDAPVLVTLGLLAGGQLDIEVFAYDGVVEFMAVPLSLIPIQFTGSVRVSPKQGSDIPKAMALIGLFAIGPLAVFGAMLAGMVVDGMWTTLVLMTLAAGWTTFTYYKLVRFSESETDTWPWIIIGVMFPILGGITLAVVKGIIDNA